MSTKTELTGCGCLIVLALMAVFIPIQGWVLMWCWNAIMPALFDLPMMTHGQGMIALVLLSLIGGYFKSSSK